MMSLLGAATLLSLAPVIAKYVVGTLPVVLYVCCLYGIAGILSLLVALIRGWKLPSYRQLPSLVFFALTARVIPAVCTAFALQKMSAVVVAFFWCLEPIIQMIVAYVVLQEKQTSRQLVAIGIGIAGLALALSAAILQCNLQISWIGCTAIMVSTLSGRVGWVGVMRFVRREHFNALALNGILMFIGSLMLMPYAVTQLQGGLFSAFITGSLVLAAIVDITGYAWWTALARHCSAGYLSFASLLAPLLTMVQAMILLHEEMHWLVFPSLAMVIFALYLYGPRMQAPQGPQIL